MIAEYRMREQEITLLMENGPGNFDVKAFVMQHSNDYPPRILVTYQITDSDGNEVDTGIEGPPEGQSQLPDDADLLYGETTVSLAVKFIQAHFAKHASASFFHPGIWYETNPDSNLHNPRKDEHTCYSLHLKGFTPEQEEEVYKKIIGAD